MATSEKSDKITLDTRFGTFEFDQTQAIGMPQGILGFADHRAFGLCYPEGEKFGKFAILQSLTDASLSFIVLPILPSGSGLIDLADMEETSQNLQIKPEDLAVLLITTIRQNPNGPSLTVNLQAPVFLDVSRRVGWQYVLHNSKYSVQHKLTNEQDS